VRVVAGRGLTAADRPDTEPVVVVNEAFVRRFFAPNEDPVGWSMYVLTAPQRVDRRIVGVVADTRHQAIDMEPEPAYYTPYAQVEMSAYPTSEMNLVVSTTGDPATTVRALPDLVRAHDRRVLVTDVAPMTRHVDRSVERRQFATVLLQVFAAVAVVLAVVGVYGVMAFAVSERRSEIGIRLALGAQASQVVRRFVLGGVSVAVVGIVVGLAGAAAFTQLQTSLLFGVQAVDATTYLVAAAVFSVAAALASWLPARRAARVDAGRVLRG
jgi:putative ABC transport system permease protein